MSVHPIAAHGGYLFRAESLAGIDLQAVARASLESDGVAEPSSGLFICRDVDTRLLRLAYDGPHTYGPAGADWYRSHHALARALSVALPMTVHAYAFDPDRFEAVAAYAGGAVVGGETLVYEALDLEVEELSEAAFEAERQRWPMGRLARLFGLTREELLRLPYAEGTLLSLQGVSVDVASVLPPAAGGGP